MSKIADLPRAFGIDRITERHVDLLADLFSALRKNGDDRFFHPHALTKDQAKAICAAQTCDLYFLMQSEHKPLAYGMLRGWEEGFAIPSLGIAVHPHVRGQGFGRVMLDFLHGAARFKGARQVRLTVEPDNRLARALYEKVGYRFGVVANQENVGILTLEH
jgi:GNAT superfamily N-acetyltransferase